MKRRGATIYIQTTIKHRMATDDNVKFRRSKEWKSFRESLLDQVGNRCQLCGTRLSGKQKKRLQIHHLDPENYNDLDPQKFRVLCTTDHKLVEKMATKILGKNPEDIPFLDRWVSLLGDFLPLDAQIKAEELLK